MWGESDMPQYNALFGVSFLAFLNLISIPNAMELVMGHSLFEDSRLIQLLWFGLFFTVLIVSYFFLGANGKYKKTAKRFSGETNVQKRTRLVIIWLYAIGSLAVSYGLIAIRHSLRGAPLIG
jgi:heme/copper-type cytochrome/quinol oxidase subunit 2